MKIARALAVCATLGPAAAFAECRQALALALDVSGSVDAREYRLQMDGLAQALSSDTVRGALMQMPGAPVQVLVYEWSGPGDHATVVPWTSITSETVLDDLITTLRGAQRRVSTPGTALGGAMQRGAAHLAQTECWVKTLDISGDGKSNLGPRPRDVKAELGGGFTVNALVIGADAPQSGDLRQAEIAELSSYFEAEVIMGPDAFVQVALGFDGYAEAMTLKLERELQTMVLGQLRLGAE